MGEGEKVAHRAIFASDGGPHELPEMTAEDVLERFRQRASRR